LPVDPTRIDIVKYWLDRASLALEPLEESEDLGPRSAYDLLAAWTGVDRFSTCLPENQSRLAATLDEACRSRADELVELARSVPDPEGWLAEAREYEQSYLEGEGDSEDLATWAWALTNDLDEAELVACALERLDEPTGAVLHDRLLVCAGWYSQKGSLFLQVVPYLRALGDAVRPDLGDVDPDLELTVWKAVTVLDAYEEALSELSPEAIGAVSSAQVRTWLEELRRSR
jgi:hypothetical protein